MPDELAYAATKGGVEAFTLSLSAAVAQLGITVNAVDPGPSDTGWMETELREALEKEIAVICSSTWKSLARAGSIMPIASC